MQLLFLRMFFYLRQVKNRRLARPDFLSMRSNTGSPRFTDFPLNLKNLIG